MIKYIFTPEVSLVFSTSKIDASFDWAYYPYYMAGTKYDFYNKTPGADAFQWSVTPNATIENSTSGFTMITFPSKGSYTVTLLATNTESGSKGTYSQTFAVEDENSIQLDLTLKELTLSTTNPKQNQNATANVKLINLSRQQIAQDFYVTFVLSPDSIYDFNLPNGNDFGLGGQKFSIKESEIKEINYTFQIPTTIGTGKKYLIAKADGTNIYQEGNENNNILIIPVIIVAGQPDLIITNLSLSSNTIQAGKKYSISQTIKNIGEVATDVANPYYTGFSQFVISKDNKLDISDYNFMQTLSDSYKSLYPGQSNTTTNNNFRVPADFPPGNYYLIDLLDYKYAPYNGYRYFSVDELNEDNNIFIIPFTVANPDEPTQCTTNLSLFGVGTNSLTLSWTNGNGNSRIVIASERPLTNDNKGITVPEFPVDGTQYSANSDWSAGTYLTNSTSKVLYIGTGNSVNISNLTNDKTYIFSVFEFNSSTLDYLQRTTERAIATHLQPAINTNTWKTLIGGVGCDGISLNGSSIASLIGRCMAISEDNGNIWKFYNIDYKEEQQSRESSPNFIINNLGLLKSGSTFLYKTTDFGKTWSKIMSNYNSLITEIMEYCIMSPSVMYVLGKDVLIKTDDGGSSWKKILLTNDNSYSLSFVNDKIGFVVTLNGIVYCTNDGGNNWSTYQIDPNINYFNAPIVKFKNSNFGIITSSDKIYTTNNGGKNWTKSIIPENIFLDSKTLIFEAENIIINTYKPDNGLLISHDNGLTWKSSIINNLPSTSSNKSYLTGKSDNLFYGKRDGIYKTYTLGDSNGIVFVNAPTQQLCPNSVIIIDYQLVGTFAVDNKVALQLSDASGNFNSPAILNSVASTSSGTISGTIPYNIAVSGNYRMRVVTSSPQCISSVSSPLVFSSSTVLNFNNLRDSIVYNTSAITLSATPSGGLFKIDGVVSTTFNPNALGNHIIGYAYTSNGCTQTIEKQVLVYEPQSITQKALSTYSYYSGTKVNLPYTLNGTWDYNTILLAELSDAQGSFISPTQLVYRNTNKSDTLKSVIPSNIPSGNSYKLRISNLGGSILSNISNSINITAALTPEISIKANNAIQCSNTSTSFIATGKNLGTKPTYQWYLNGASVGINSNFYSAILNDGDVVQLKATINETNVTQSEVFSTTQYITVVNQPETPIVVQFDSILVSSSMEGNQWYKDNQPIAGAVNQFYSPVESGEYYVIVNATPCASVSSSKYTYAAHSGVLNATVPSINIYPNPAKSDFTITDLDNSIKYKYILYDIVGKQYIKNEISNLNYQKINVEKIPVGIYVLLLYKADSSSLVGAEKVIKRD